LDRLQAALDEGPAAYGWAGNQCWTMARITELIWELFRVPYTLSGVDYLLHRLDWSWQVPTRRAAERGEAAITAWRNDVWPEGKGRGEPGRLALLAR
jgi:transposase